VPSWLSLVPLKLQRALEAGPGYQGIDLPPCWSGPAVGDRGRNSFRSNQTDTICPFEIVRHCCCRPLQSALPRLARMRTISDR
jgi:hypothetical protein